MARYSIWREGEPFVRLPFHFSDRLCTGLCLTTPAVLLIRQNKYAVTAMHKIPTPVSDLSTASAGTHVPILNRAKITANIGVMNNITRVDHCARLPTRLVSASLVKR